MALNSPIGRATAIAMVETSTVPATSGRTPNRRLAKSGVHSVPVRNSTMDTSLRNPKVSTASTMMMPAVVKTDNVAHSSSARSISHSCRRLLPVFRKLDIADFLSKAANRGDVEVDELLHLGPCPRLFGHVDEERSRQWAVRARADGLEAWRDRPRALTVIDGHGLQTLTI